MPLIGEIFKDNDFYINYNSSKNLERVHEIFKNNVKKLNFYNNLEKDWGMITLSLIQEVKTPYVLIYCEDLTYDINHNEWFKMMDEIIERDISYLPIGRLWKYTREEYLSGYESGDRLWLYPAHKSPGSSLSVDAIYKTDLLSQKLTELVTWHNKPRRFPLYLPHHFEDIFIEPNGVRPWGEDILCAIPKKEILIHEQKDTETYLNK